MVVSAQVLKQLNYDQAIEGACVCVSNERTEQRTDEPTDERTTNNERTERRRPNDEPNERRRTTTTQRRTDERTTNGEPTNERRTDEPKRSDGLSVCVCGVCECPLYSLIIVEFPAR